MGAGGSWDRTPFTLAPTPYIHVQAPKSHMHASTPYFQAPARSSTAPRQICNFAITHTCTLNRLNSQRADYTFVGLYFNVLVW